MRWLRLSRTGRWLAVVHGEELELVDLPGSMPNRTLQVPSAQVEFVGKHLWILTGSSLERIAPRDLAALPPLAVIPGRPERILAGHGAAANDAVLIGHPTVSVSVRSDRLIIDPIELRADEEVVAAIGNRMLIAGPSWLRMVERPRGELWRAALPVAGKVLACSVLFGGKAIAVLIRDEDGDRFLVVRATGGIAHNVQVAASQRVVFAEELGHALLLDDGGEITRVDLRYGRVLHQVRPAISTADLAVDQDGRTLVLAETPAGAGRAPGVVVMMMADLFNPGHRAAAAAATITPPAADATAEATTDETAGNRPPTAATPADGAPVATPKLEASPIPTRPPPLEDAADGDAPPGHDERPAIEIPDLLPLAFGARPPAPPAPATADSPYPTARAHLDALLDLVASRVAVAIAEAWNSGRLSSRDATGRPYELEVGALIGGVGGYAADKLAETMRQVEQKQREASARAAASAARGVRLPFPDLAREVGLSAVAAQILLLASAPSLRGEIGRLYGVLSNDPARPTIDRFLIEQVVAGSKSSLRDQIARELAPDAPLVRFGLVRVESGPSLYARLSVSDPVLDRLRGLPISRADDVTMVRAADLDLASLHVSAAVKRELVLAVSEPHPPHDPLRLVIRGRRGSGRHSMIAAVADRIAREIAAIDTARMPRQPREFTAALRAALFRASIHGLIPVVSGLELIEPTDTELRESSKQVIRNHPGPVVLRASPEATLPIDAGFASITLPPLSETERAAAWKSVLTDAELDADADLLASRYRCGPGVVTRVAAQLASRGNLRGDVTDALDQQVKQHVATRLNHVASNITRRASWEDVALPDDMLDSLREFIGRARHRRTVYETWGYDRKMTTSRGLTALFYGPPGTGKTMVAGVISSELGLELYRVDLARVVSKWLGETEKNLSEVFDAAEDGQVLILFDEADSLFAKRTDVKTSNDRYSNLEVNYLLQRLDTFEGIAVLTSNQDSAIDPAFRRRLSLRLQFPFPDEEMRVRLWQAHITPQTPLVGDIDFIELARRFPLSGGYIRNSSLRAAFLAAHEGVPMTQEHLLRAVQLEYRELGKLSTTSRIE